MRPLNALATHRGDVARRACGRYLGDTMADGTGMTAGTLDAAAYSGVYSTGADELDPPALGACPAAKPDIIIRLPQKGDWRALEALLRKQHARTVFADIPISDRKLAMFEGDARNPQPHQCLLVAECQARVVGLTWVTAGDYVLGEGCSMTTVHLLAVDTDHCGPFRSAKVFIKLLRGITAWSKTRGARQILIHVTTGTAIKQTDRLLRAGGGVCLGGSYVVDVK